MGLYMALSSFDPLFFLWRCPDIEQIYINIYMLATLTLTGAKSRGPKYKRSTRQKSRTLYRLSVRGLEDKTPHTPPAPRSHAHHHHPSGMHVDMPVRAQTLARGALPTSPVACGSWEEGLGLGYSGLVLT